MRADEHRPSSPPRTAPGRIELDPAETAQIRDVLTGLRGRHRAADSPEFLRDAVLARDALPPRLREFLDDVRVAERHAACVVAGFPVDDARIGPTPTGWSRQPDRMSTVDDEMWLVLCASLLGDVFGWATQQDGALIHDICPAPGYEHSQQGSGSAGLLWWHTEEAFHPLKCDYLGLLCLRNDGRVATTYATVENLALDDEVREILFQPWFVIRPDDSHLEQARPGPAPGGRTAHLVTAARARIVEMNERPVPVPVLSGDPASPYLCIDPFFMRVVDEEPRARAALDSLCAAIDASLQDVALAPGEILFIDNFRAVHGRQPFQARYDGRDRWLKRVNVTRDLRKSRAHRHTSDSRIVF